MAAIVTSADSSINKGTRRFLIYVEADDVQLDRYYAANGWRDSRGVNPLRCQCANRRRICCSRSDVVDANSAIDSYLRTPFCAVCASPEEMESFTRLPSAVQPFHPHRG